MAILLLNRLSRTRLDVSEWFADLDEEIYWFTSEEAVRDYPEFGVSKGFGRFAVDARVDVEAVRLFREKPFRRILALEETEIIRAGRLRSRFGLEGQSYESAIAFRDKVVMKTIAQDGGFEVPPFRKVESGLDLFDFIEEHGLPVIVKPVSGMFSANTVILRKEQDVEQWLEQGEWKEKMVESFVGGDLYHVDGLVINGELRFVCTFAYINTCLSYVEQSGVGDLLLSQNNPIHVRLSEYARRLLQTMPTPSNTSFHLEVFLTPDGRVVLCEIASRTSGAYVQEQIQHAFGIEMNRFALRAQCGRIDTLPEIPNNHPVNASYYLPPRHGVLRQMPIQVPVPGVICYKANGQIGKAYQGPQYSCDHYALVAVEGRDEQEVAGRLQEAIDYVEKNSVWE